MFEIHYTNDNVDRDGHNCPVTHLEPHWIQTHTKRSRLSFHYQLCTGWTKSSIYTVIYENFRLLPAADASRFFTLFFSPCGNHCDSSPYRCPCCRPGLHCVWAQFSRPAVFTGRKLSPAAWGDSSVSEVWSKQTSPSCRASSSTGKQPKVAIAS